MPRRLLAAGLLVLVSATVRGQVPPGESQAAPDSVTFAQAIDLAARRNLSVQQAAEEILRAQALLREATAAVLPSLGASAVTTTLNQGREFSGTVTTPRNQLALSATLSGLLFAPVQWALRVQAADNVRVTEAAAAETRRQVTQATALAYLAIIARARVVDANVRAREVARAHYELASHLRETGAGSRLNELRAQQSLSSDEALVQQSRLDLYRAEEALGVLVNGEGPLAASGEPLLEVPADLRQAEAAMPAARTDLLLADARARAAARVVSDSWKDYLPSVAGLFQPQYVKPETIFQPSFTWRLQVQASVPIFEFGFRRAKLAERQALLHEATLAQAGALLQARSDVRSAEEALRLSEQALVSARAAADQAQQVVEIVNVSYKAGAATNIEVIDAQREARDADTAAAVAEDQVRQARLALLIALGRFP
jgi:outer membrane protein TolC